MVNLPKLTSFWDRINRFIYLIININIIYEFGTITDFD